MSRAITVVQHTEQPALVLKTRSVNVVEAAVEQALTSPAVANAVNADIKNLAQTVKGIRQGFRAVADGLIGFDSSRYVDKNKEVLQLRPTWLEYQTRFDKILEESHRNALAASSMIRQYTEAILTDVDPSEIEDLRDELRGFLQKLNEKAPTARRTYGDLQQLADDVRSFKAVIDDILGKAEDKCNEDVKMAKDHLQNLEKMLQSVNDERTVLTSISKHVLANSALLAGGLSAITAICVLSPTAGMILIEALGVGVAIDAGVYKYRDSNLLGANTQYSSELIESWFDLKYQESRHRELVGHGAALAQTKERIDALAEKIDTITEIWQVLKCDMQQLQEELELVVDPSMSITKRFLKKLRHPREVYNRLADLLELYAKGKFYLS
ncbi:hypothetical protein DICSQDRAFT_173023 [Dichomitus squalens LYAD-421 SS1]|uniref:Uncharacterized protein n=1 Tax=Dichomitus squalens (strain LYAD-421) TaxID=732165 RepID=R7SRF7_DICSQ|nr:uncharacterized protein DICSQDRAFT_173023 [Dichomitus squalens LYAD-421 SS1]EJF58340.1 hypothetical protein DICSQDRAFT_173023 [Dichomitus squalens LYAD-421 SS1]